MKNAKQIIAWMVMVAIVFLYIPVMADNDILSDIRTALDALELPDGETVSEDIYLPSQNAAGDINITWESDDENAVMIVGNYALPLPGAGERAVTVTATARKDGQSASKSFELIVPKVQFTGEYLIDESFENDAVGQLPSKGSWLLDPSMTTGIIGDDVYLGIAQEPESASNHALKISKTAGIDVMDPSKGKKIRPLVYASFDAPQQGELIIEYKTRIDAVNGDAIFPWFTDAFGNTIANQFLRIAAIPENESGFRNTAESKSGNVVSSLPYQTWYDSTFTARTVVDTYEVDGEITSDARFDYEINGELQGIDLLSRNNAGTYINNLLFGFDELTAKGGTLWVDDVKVYMNTAALFADQITPEQIGCQETDAVTSDLQLPTSIDGIDVNYISSDTEVLTEEGKITRPAPGELPASVILYVIVEKDGFRSVKQFPLQILPHDDISMLLNSLDLNEFIGGQSIDAIQINFSLPMVLDGYPITWETSDDQVLQISKEGKVTVLRSDRDKAVTLTASITTTQTTSRNFLITVKGTGDVLELPIEDIVGQPLYAVTEDFSLPPFTADGGEITWSTSDPNFLFLNGTVAYVLRGTEERSVTLTADVERDGFYARSQYALTLAPLSANDIVLVDEDFEDTQVNSLPDTLMEDGATLMWRPDQTITGKYANAYYYVIEEKDVLASTGNNKVLQAGNKAKGSNIHGVVHLTFDASAESVIEVEYMVYAPSTSYGHIWASTDRNPGMGNDFLRFSSNLQAVSVDGLINTTITGLAEGWHKIRLTVDILNQKFDFYVDDELRIEDGDTKANGTSFSRICFGYAQDAEGYYLIDNVRVWESVSKSVEAYAQALDIGDLSAITKDLKLPEKTILGDANLRWFSSNEAYISNTGKVNRPSAQEGDAQLMLYAIVEKDGFRALRALPATVKRNMTDLESVQADFDAVSLDTDNLVFSDLSLRTVGSHGSELVWSSSRPDIIDPTTGKVSRPQFNNQENIEVILTCVVKKGEVTSDPKQYTLYVPEQNFVLESNISGSSDIPNARFPFVADGNIKTSWVPATSDKNPEIIIRLEKAVSINRLMINGIFSMASVSYSNDGTNYTKLGEGADMMFDGITARYIRLAFTGDTISVNEIGLYYIETDDVLVQLDAEAVDLGNLSGITQDLDLPAQGERGSQFAWKSSNTQYLSNHGEIVQLPASGSVSVALTLTATQGNATATRVFTVTIYAKKAGGGISSGVGKINSSGGSGGSAYSPAMPDIMPVTPQIEPTIQFSDLQDVPWAEDAIMEFAKLGYIDGTTESTFAPNQRITREEFLKILLNVLDLTGNSADVPFADVGPKDWYFIPVSTGYHLGIISGMSEEFFGAGLPITREDMAVMTVKATNVAQYTFTGPNKQFSDMDKVAGYARESVAQLCGEGIMVGYENGEFHPKSQATRAEAVVMLSRLKSLLSD